ncbi:MAG: hypothetical protein OXB84_02205 [Halobacteriovoraceae bacterium]|nr:hypothetical protein [Halobacteriovoraceae bacterium]
MKQVRKNKNINLRTAAGNTCQVNFSGYLPNSNTGVHLKSLNWIFLICLLTSCSSYYRRAMIAQKMNLYDPRIKHFPVTPFHVVDDHFKQKNRRKYSSIKHQDKKQLQPRSVHTNEKMTAIHSNRQLYFLTLLSQYDHLSVFSQNKKTQIRHCPGFHSSVLDYRKRLVFKKAIKQKIKQDNYSGGQWRQREYLSLFPELILPVRSSDKSPLVVDLIREKGIKSLPGIIQKAFSTHLEKLYGELQELCESGVSSNYYNYENLITISLMNSGLMPSRENMKVLLKLTVFSNMALINSLSTQMDKTFRFPSSLLKQDIYMDEVVRRLSVDWVRDYFKDVDKKRKKVSSVI